MKKSFIIILILGGISHILRSSIEFLEPSYWNPISLIDYLAVILTTFQDLFLGIALISMVRFFPNPNLLKEKLWYFITIFSSFGLMISGLGNLLEDAFKLREIGGALFTYGGMGGAVGLLMVFLSSLAIPIIRKRWSWFYLIPLISVILFSDFGGFITGSAMLLLAIFEFQRSHPN